MKAVILAGGLGSRLSPLTRATNKHLLPIYDKPMIYYPIQLMVDAGIKDIMIVTGGPHAGDFIRVLKNGEDFGLNKLHYAYQEGEGGIADALSKAETFIGSDNCAVVLGDNIISEDISHYVKDFENGVGARIFTKAVTDPERFGVVSYDPVGGGVNDIVEKPEFPPSEDAVIGLYFYDNSVFSKIRDLVPSSRGELEVTDINKKYLSEDRLVLHRILGTWIDCGTFESLARATNKFYDDSKS